MSATLEDADEPEFGSNRTCGWSNPRGAERRIFPRKELQARVAGKRLDHTIQAPA